MVHKLLALAAGEIGVKESPAGSNRVKYNTAYYGRAVSGSAYPWCCVFQWWLFQEAGASGLFFGGGKTASCTALYDWYRKQGRTVDKSALKPGDLVFFNFSGDSVKEHVGICESAGGGYVTTIDGNTGSGSEANGGAVMRRRRALKYVAGAARPDYESAKKEETMTGKEIYAALNDYLASQPVPDWAKAELEEAVAAGITDGKNGMQLIPRYQAAIMAKRAAEKG